MGTTNETWNPAEQPFVGPLREGEAVLATYSKSGYIRPKYRLVKVRVVKTGFTMTEMATGFLVRFDERGTARGEYRYRYGLQRF